MYNEAVAHIISKEKHRFEEIANMYIKGFEDQANKSMYDIFIQYGYKSDCDDTNQLLSYVGDLVTLFKKQQTEEVWKQVVNFEEYECTIEGDVRRIDNKHIMKISDNGRYKLSKNGKIVTARLIDIVMPTWYFNKENNTKDMKYEYVYTSSDLYDDEAMHMSGNLEFSSTTETRA